MGRALRSLLLLATLSLWLGSAGAFCVSAIAYEYVMRGDEPAPEPALLCCAVSSPSVGAVQKDRPLEGRVPAAPRARAPAIDGLPLTVTRVLASPLRWRAYCERSCRLLR